MRVSPHTYAALLAVSLAVAAWRLLIELRGQETKTRQAPSAALALPIGGAIGWLSGVVGVGGGIFLTPLMVLLRWATPAQAAATSASFIVANSVAGLAGRFMQGTLAVGGLWPLAIAACAGGVVGSRLGATQFSGRALKRVLAVVLVIAVIKLVRMSWG